MMNRSRGIALVIVLFALAVFSALGLGLLLTTTTERLTSANYELSVHAANAADSALELAARELASIVDWDAVLTGARQSRFIEGVPPLDLAAFTNQLACGRAEVCTAAQRGTSTAERPWGVNNPAWQVFLRAPASRFLTIPSSSADTFVVVWVGDDGREADGDPLGDGGGATGEGRDVLRARAEVFGRSGTRHAVEADLVRDAAGIRVQSWRVRSAALP